MTIEQIIEQTLSKIIDEKVMPHIIELKKQAENKPTLDEIIKLSQAAKEEKIEKHVL